ncbi:MAG: DUF3352 domain-containing protein [Bacteroidales bacterium]|jgi:hypothetical protein|nr:DUF3352 domain-containing protein [Bacteroidales bacterium]
MKKWRLIFIGILLLAIASLLAVTLFGSKTDKQMTETIGLVPVNANMIVEIRDFEALTAALENQPDYWDDLCNYPKIAQLYQQIQLLDSLTNSQKEIQSLLWNNPIIISIHNFGKNQLGAIFLIALPENQKKEALQKHIESLFANAEITKREYDNHNIFDIKTENQKRYTYTITKRNFVFSANSLLVEDVIRQSGIEKNLTTDIAFQETYRTAGEKEIANFYINLSRLSNLMTPFFHAEIIKKHPAFEKYGTWIALDLSLKEKIVSLNGFATTTDSSIYYLNHLSAQDKQKFEFDKILPEGTALYYAQSLSDIEQFEKTRRQFLDETKYADYFNEQNKTFNETTNADLAKLVYGLSNNEVCFAISNINRLDIFQNAYLIVSSQSQSQSEKMISEFLKKYTKHTSQSYNDYTGTIDLGPNHKYPLYRFPVENWPELYYGSFFSAVDAAYCTIIDNYVVFGRDKAALTRFVNDVLLNKTLEKSPVYQDFKKNLSRESQSIFYLNVRKAIPWLLSNLNVKASKNIMKQDETLSHFNEFVIQQVVSDDMIYHNIALQHREIDSEAPHTVWESRLDTAVRMKPVIVKNHNTNEKEIFVQDVNHTIYLINRKGIILWKIPLDEEIISEVYQIDAFRNTKLQYLFNTKSKIYLIDRIGNHVDRFPVNLRSAASCGLALFDYDKSRDYRICLPTEDKKIYMYNIEGNLVSGFDFEGSEHPLTVPPQHIRNGRKDYIVLHDKYRIYILNRRGETRVQPKQQFNASKRNQFWFIPNEAEKKASITTTDTRGVVYHTYLDGSVDTVFFRPYSENHYFMYRDFDADGNADYLFFDQKTMEVFDHYKNPMMNYQFENNITEEPAYYMFSSTNHKVGITDKSAEKLYLINSNGELHKGFPLTGTSPFSISYMSESSQQFNLFVGGKGKFLYNYEVK